MDLELSWRLAKSPKFLSLLAAIVLLQHLVNPTVTLAAPAKRHALVIAIADYQSLTTLNNPIRDAQALADVLGQNGFQVSLHKDVEHSRFEAIISDFARLTQGAEEAIVFYSGHGMALVRDGSLINALAPRDAKVDCKTRVGSRIIAMEQILDSLKHVPKKVAIFDACRSSPFIGCSTPGNRGFGFRAVQTSAGGNPGTSRSTRNAAGPVTKGFVPVRVEAQSSLVVSYSSDLGGLALDGAKGKNSPFMSALLKELQASPRLPLRQVLDRTSKRVANATQFFQVPWVVTRGGEPDICLNGNGCETNVVLENAKLVAQSRYLAEQANQSIARGDTTLAKLLAIEALPDKSRKNDPIALRRPFVGVAEEVAYAAKFYGVRERLIWSDLPSSSVAVHPDGQRILIASNNEASIWTANDGKYVSSLEGFEEAGALFWGRGGRYIFAGDGEKISVWDALTGKRITKLAHRKGGQIWDLAGSTDGTWLVAGAGHHIYPGKFNFAEGNIQVWDTASGIMLKRLTGHKAAVNAVAVSPDKSFIVSGSKDKTIRVWDTQSWKPRYMLSGHTDAITSVAVSSDGRLIASGSHDKTVRIWDSQSGKLLRVIEGQHDHSISDVSFHPIRAILATTSREKVRLWDLKTAKVTTVLSAHREGKGTFYFVTFFPDGQQLVTGASDHTVRIWDVNRGQSIQQLNGKKFDRPLGVVRDPNGEFILRSRTDDEQEIVWNVKSGRIIARLKGVPWAEALKFDINRSRLLLDYGEDPIALHNAKSGELIASGGQPELVLGAAFDARYERIASRDGSTGILWDGSTGKKILELRGHKGVVSDVAFIPNSKNIVTASHDETARIWDGKTGKQLFVLKGHSRYVNSVAVSPDGSKIVTGSDDNTALLWDALRGSLLMRLEGHTSSVEKVMFSPDGRRILSAAPLNDTVAIWDAETGQRIAVLKGHLYGVRGMAFNKAFTEILTLSGNYEAWIWPVFPTTQQHVTHLKKTVPRCLTLAERRQFHLSPLPPRWCITGVGNEEERDPTKWQPKLPYASPDWVKWQLARNDGKLPEVPDE